MKPKADLKGHCRLPATAKQEGYYPDRQRRMYNPRRLFREWTALRVTALLTWTRTSRWPQRREKLCSFTALLQRLSLVCPAYYTGLTSAASTKALFFLAWKGAEAAPRRSSSVGAKEGSANPPRTEQKMPAIRWAHVAPKQASSKAVSPHKGLERGTTLHGRLHGMAHSEREIAKAHGLEPYELRMSADKQGLLREPRMPCILYREWWVGENSLRITDPAQAESCTAKCCLVFPTHRENTVFLCDKLCLHFRRGNNTHSRTHDGSLFPQRNFRTH